jgi:signal transduction histidine kinase
VAALKVYARQFSSATGIRVAVKGKYLVDRMPLTHEVAVYRVLQGALSNVMKHSKAQNVSVSVARKQELRIDDGDRR